MSSGLILPKGQKAQREVGIPVVKTAIGELPIRSVDIEGVCKGEIPPIDAFVSLTCQDTDRYVLTLLALLELAKDIYGRQPEGPRHFEQLCKDVGLKIQTLEKRVIDFSEELGKI